MHLQPETADTTTEPSTPSDAGSDPSPWQFRLAVLRYHALVYRTAFALLRNRQEAEDVTQEAFMRYWQSGAGVRRPKEWLLKVGRNASLDRLRAAGRYTSTIDETNEPGDERDPAWHYQQAELSQRLDALISELPEPQRSLIILFDVHGLKGAACARILGISVNQVKVYLHRARRRLRREWEQQS